MTKSASSSNRKGESKQRKRTASGSNFFRFIFSPAFLITILIIAAAIAVYWFLPDIINWWEETWENIISLFGIGILFPIIIIIILISIIVRKNISTFFKNWNRWIGFIILVAFTWGLIALINSKMGGLIGLSIISEPLSVSILILILLLFLGIFFIIPKHTFNFLVYLFRTLITFFRNAIRAIAISCSQKRNDKINKDIVVLDRKTEAQPISTSEIESIMEPQKESSSSTPLDLSLFQSAVTIGGWQLPPLAILDKPAEPEITQADVDKRAEILEQALASYGVDARVVGKHVGPTVTQYEVEPGWDKKYKEIREKDKDGNIKIQQQEISKTRVKVERISSLSNDLALAMAAPSIRIEAPVPGKSVVGVEVPNTTFGSVNLRSIIESTAYQKTVAKSNLAIPLGKGPGGEVASADLAKMPHLLVAGATGSGKTVYLNSIICCLLFSNTPDDLKFIMIDPKRVELINFNNLPHLIAPVVVDTDKAVLALKWLVGEMDNRYRIFSQSGVRNIEAYNKDRTPGDQLPFVVLIIDELADLMMTAFGEVEQNLCRLAQLSRATGIHLIVATQRPSVDVITGLIKANFPTRISFSLTSQVDSRTILDSTGAEKLLGRGDMLYMPTDASKPKRLQGPFLSDSEIDRLVQFWSSQNKTEAELIKFEDYEQRCTSDIGDEDTLMETARQLASVHSSVSTSFLQRKLKIGYPRAARIMEKLREEGY